ncbi:MAG TPA: RNase adapter RapZ [Alphaproteobacteria bacterium]|nr:RNase adapter RapZ [Alphaproteobacteria bacterium]
MAVLPGTSEMTRARALSRRVVLVTGMSGAGKTVALKALEDAGYEAVDNLPLSLLSSLVRPDDRTDRPIAIGIDTRTRDFGTGPFLSAIDRLKAEQALNVNVLFVDCDDEVLRRRFTETRRRHPLAADRPVVDGISAERSLIHALRDRADVILDTSNLPQTELRRQVQERFALDAEPGLAVSIISFAYRHGLPREADLVFDVRFLANPHYVAALEPLTGRDQAVGDYIRDDPGFAPFIENLTAMLRNLLPRYQREGKSYLTVGIGCTGGKHRSVFVAELLAAQLRQLDHRVVLVHRDMEREGERRR